MKKFLPQKSLTLILFAFMLMCMHLGSAQSISYGFAYDLNNSPTLVGTPFSIASEAATARGITFSNNGTKVYIVSAVPSEVNQYSLTTPFDINGGASFDGSPFNVDSEETNATGIAFNNTGTKMFIIGAQANEINQYSLANPFDITSGVTFDGSPFSVTSQETEPEGLAFNLDGSKMYVVGSAGDEVNQYNLSSPFDVTSGVTVDGSPRGIFTDSSPRDIAFNSDGSKMFILGAQNDAIYQYSLTTPFDINDGISYTGTSLSVTSQEAFPQGMFFDSKGHFVYVTGSSGDEVNQYNLNAGGFEESNNLGQVQGSLTLQLEGETFINASGTLINSTHYSIANLPVGLTPSLDVAADGASVALGFSGNADDHQVANSVASLEFTFLDGAFTGNDASSVANAVAASSGFGIDFDDNPTINYETNPLGGAQFDGTPFSIATEETFPADIQFNPDGSKMYIVGFATNRVHQYSLSVNFDTHSSVSLDGNTNVAGQETAAKGLAFSDDGTKMFITGSTGDDVTQYLLSNPFDVTSGVSFAGHTFSVASEETTPEGIAFSTDGHRMFIVGRENFEVNQYSLTTAFDISSGVSFDGSPFSISSEDLTPQAIAFNNDGTKMFIAGSSGDDINVYSLSTPFDVTAGVSFDENPFSVALEELNPAGIAFNGDDSKMYIVGYVGDDVNQYSLNTGRFKEGDSNDGSVTGSTFISIANDSFTSAGGSLVNTTDYSISNLPSGLTPTITIAGNGLSAILTLTSNADDHEDLDDVPSLQFTFENSAFTSGDASIVLNASNAMSNFAIDFEDAPVISYGKITSQSIATYDGLHDIANEETTPTGSTFSNDGLKMFVIGASENTVNQYTLTRPFDIRSGVTFDGSPYSFASESTGGASITFSTNGTKMFITGGGEVVEYSLSIPFDVVNSTVTLVTEFDVSATETNPRGIDFSSDGLKLFVVGANSKLVSQFNLTNAFSLSSGVSVAGSGYSVANETTFPVGITFDTDGTKMYITDNLQFTVFEYSVASPFDITSEVNFVTNRFTLNSVSQRDIYFNPDMTRMYILSQNPDAQNQYGIAGFIESISDDGSVSGSLTLTINGDVFSNAGGTLSSDDYTINNLPEGLVSQITVAADGTSALLTLSGIALAHVDVLSSLQFTFENSAFTNVAATNFSNAINAESNFGIDFINLIDAPTDIAIGDNAIAENEASGTAVGSFTTTDDDVGETYTYTFAVGTGDTDNASFAIVGDELQSGEVFDFEIKDTYAIRVNTNDGNGGDFEKQFSISISNVFETPTDLDLSANTIAENNVVADAIGTFSTTDEDAGETYLYSLVAGIGDDDNASFTLVGDELQAGEVFDFETKESYDIRVQTDDQNGNTYPEAFTITITNEVANITDIALDSENVNENEASGTTVGLLSTVGTEVTGSITYTLVSGTGGSDNASFAISGAQLNTASVFDFETKSSYAIRVQTDDGEGVTFEKEFTIMVDNVFEAPTDLSLSATAINENNSVNATIGTLSTTDEDAGETYTYSLASGTGDTDNASFNVSGNLLRASEAFNFESKTSYNIRLQTNDGNGGTRSEAFVITINNLSEAPTDLALSASSITENNAINVVIGTLSTTDDDTGETFTYTLASGSGDTDNASFNISGNSFRASEVFDFESQNAYSVRVQTDDGNGGTLEEAFSISVTNQSEAPTDMTLSSSDIDESSPIGSTIGNINTVDEDNGETYTYTLVSGTGATDNASFSISGNALQSAEIFDFETKTSYTIRLETNDGNGGLLEKAFTININNLPPGLTGVGITSASIDENLSSGSSVGDLFALGDEIDGVTFTFTLASGSGDTDNGLFSISSDELLTSSSFDFETTNQYSIRVMADDGAGSTVEQIILIDVNDVNEAPTDLLLSASTIAENNAINETIGSFSSTDEDTGDTHSYSFVSGAGDTDNSSFSISGVLLQASESFDFEAKSTYSIRVQTNDGNGGTYSEVFSISISDQNDEPTALLLNVTSINENNAISASAGTFSTTDQDSGDSFTYTLVSGAGDTDNGSFNLSGDQLQAGIAFDFEVKNSYSIRVQTSDGNGGSFEESFTITVNDVNENPSDIALSSASLEESNPVGSLVGSLSSTDQDQGQTFTYSLASGTGDSDNAAFSISGNDILSAEVFDFETKASYSVRVQSNDGNGGTYEEAFTISINDLPASVTSFDLSNNSISENEASGFSIGSFSTSGEDLSGTFTYSLVSGTGDTDNASFNISGDQLLTSSSFDFETQSSYSIRLMTDDGIQSDEQVFSISVNDLSEAPSALLLSASSITENNAVADEVGSFSTTDEDSGETHTYSFVSGTGDDDNASFTIAGSQLQAAGVFDFETQTNYTIRVETNDGNGGTLQQAFSISITDENEAPVLTSALTDVTVTFGFVSSQKNLSTAFSDPEGDAFTLTTSSSDESIVTSELQGTTLIVSGSGIGSVVITVTANDGNGGVTSTTFNFTVEEAAQAAPTAIDLSSISIDENLPVNTVAAEITSTDINPNDAAVYALVSGEDDDDNGSFSISGSQLLTSEIFDFDTKSNYSIRLQVDDQNGGTFEETFTITVNDLGDNAAPTVAVALSDLSENAGFASTQIDLTTTFSDMDGDDLTISASNSDETVVTVQIISGDQLQINEVGVGTSTITVTADDGNGGTISDELIVTVSEALNNAPIVANSLGDEIIVEKGFGARQVSYATTFSDPDGDDLTITVASSDETVVTVNLIANDQMSINEETVGQSTITVTADDGNGGTVSETFLFTVTEVTNNVPTVANPIDDQTSLIEGFTALEVSYATTFEDADGDVLSITVTSSDETVVTANVIANDQIMISEVGTGTSTITVTADDGNGGVVSDEFVVTVSEAANNAPTVVDPIADQTSLTEGFAVLEVSYATTFEDTDGDVLTITVASSDETVVTATVIANNQIQIDEVGIGTSTITVTADDGNGGGVSDEFVVTVSEAANNAPTVVDPIADQTSLTEGFAVLEVSYATTFEDTDGDVLTITVASSDETVVTSTLISNNQIQINEVGIGTSTITVTAADGNGGVVSDEFIVTVSEAPNNAPTVVDPINDQTTLVEGFGAFQVNYSTTFEDADGDDLTITVSSSDEAVVTATVIANNQIQIDEIGTGTSTITVTADDGNGGIVSDEFIVTVLVLGLQEETEISIYPNPVVDFLSIQTKDEVSVRLVNAEGKALLKTTGTQFSMDLRSFKSGVYFLLFDDGDTITQRRIIKAN